MTDRERLLTTLAAVHAFYGRELTELATGFWLQDLDGYEVGAIERAFAAHRRDTERGQFCPMPADILRQLRGDAAERAAVAWGEVLRVARTGGAGVSDLPDAARQALRDMGGIGVIQRSEESENGFLQRRFVEAYQAYRRREEAAHGQAIGRGLELERLQ